MRGTMRHAIAIVDATVASLNEHPTTLNLSLGIATSSIIIVLLLLEVATYPHDPASLSRNLNASCPTPRASPQCSPPPPPEIEGNDHLVHFVLPAPSSPKLTTTAHLSPIPRLHKQTQPNHRPTKVFLLLLLLSFRGWR
jgi:hypothetical protein